MSAPVPTLWWVLAAPGQPWPLPATATATADLPDVNVWLALAVQEHPHHTLARDYWSSAVLASATDAQPRAWFCRTTMLGLVRRLCQPKVVGTGARHLAAALGLYRSWRAAPRIGLLADPASTETDLGVLLTSTQPPARLWADAYLAVLARSSGLRRVSFDRDFAHFGLARCLILPTP